MSQYTKPIGFWGRILAKGMAWGHRDFYENTSKALCLKQEDKYLEVGFGSGYFIKKYVFDVSRISGLDYSKDMVDLASDVNKELVRTGKAEFKQGDVVSLPWEDNEFSVAVAIETFYFWSDPAAALEEIHRVLIPGGRIVIEMAYNRDDGLDHSKDMKKMDLTLYSVDEIQKLLNEAGFVDMEVIYYKGFKVPLKGYVVPKGMVVKAYKKNE